MIYPEELHNNRVFNNERVVSSSKTGNLFENTPDAKNINKIEVNFKETA
jgi:hypothetical protein